MLDSLGFLLVSLGLVSSRDTIKGFRSLPAISNSLVNLGKMDISFHFNSKTSSEAANLKPELFAHTSSPFFLPRQEPMIQQTVEVERSFEPCPCSSIKEFRNPFLGNSPSDMLGKILKSNDLFSYNQEPIVSTTCCDSHEHIQEDTVYFDFNPKNHAESAMHPAISPFPLMLDSVLPKMESTSINSKPKAIEIFFFPKNKEGFMDLTKLMSSPTNNKKSKKSEIQIVGDKELKNEFKSLKYRPSIPLLRQRDMSTVYLEKNGKKEKKEEKPDMETRDDKQESMMPVTTEKSTPAPFTASSTNLLP